MLENRSEIDAFDTALAGGNRPHPVSYIASLDADRQPARLHFGLGAAAVGSVLVARSERAVAGILYGANEDDVLGQLRGHFPGAEPVRDDFETCRIIANVLTLIQSPEAGADHESRCELGE